MCPFIAGVSHGTCADGSICQGPPVHRLETPVRTRPGCPSSNRTACKAHTFHTGHGAEPGRRGTWGMPSVGTSRHLSKAPSSRAIRLSRLIPFFLRPSDWTLEERLVRPSALSRRPFGRKVASASSIRYWSSIRSGESWPFRFLNCCFVQAEVSSARHLFGICIRSYSPTAGHEGTLLARPGSYPCFPR